MREKIIFGLKILIILSIIALTGLVYFHQGDFTSVDLGRHLKNGQIVWQESGVLFENFYSFSETDLPFINHHWLSGVIFWWLYLIGGFKILTVLNIILSILTALIVFKLTVKKSNFWLASILILPVILLLSERVDIRPEMFSYVFIVLTYYLLEDFRETNNTKKLIWLVPMFLFWVNLHIYFFIGLFLIGLAMLEQLILSRFARSLRHYKDFFKVESSKKFFYIALASAAACLFNPNFIKGLTYPFNIMKKYGYDIVENKSPFYLETLTINYNITIFKIFLGLLVLSFILSIIIKRKIHPVKSSQAGAKLFNGINFYNLILAVIFSVFACLYIRNLPLFGLIILPVMAQNYFQAAKYLKEKPVKMEIIILASVLVIYGLVLGLIVYDNSGEKKFLNKNFGLGMSQGSLESIKFYQTNNLRGPIFNNYDLGGALIFWLFPAERVFVDNRPEAYSVEFFSQIYKPMQEDEAKWKELSARFNINLIYFSHTDGTPWARKFLAARLHDDNWPLIYFDDYTVIMITNGDNNKFLIEKNKINNDKFVFRLEELLKSANDKERVYLAELAVLYGRADLAENIYQIILAKRPADGKILALLGFLYAGGAKNEDVLKSLEYLAKAIRSGYELPAVYNQLGLDYWNLADYNEAKNMWQKALRLDSANEHAKYYLNQANWLIK